MKRNKKAELKKPSNKIESNNSFEDFNSEDVSQNITSNEFSSKNFRFKIVKKRSLWSTEVSSFKLKS
jgi:hypothetical protein